MSAFANLAKHACRWLYNIQILCRQNSHKILH